MFPEDRHKSELKHECELPPEDNVCSRYITSGYFVGLRRWFRSCMVVNENNPRSRAFFKSNFVIKKEKITQLEYFYYMIHPFSSFRSFWEFCQILSMLTQLLMNPLRIISTRSWIIYVSLACDVMTVFDIIVQFNTGFQNKVSNIVILHRHFVAGHYLYTTFVFDFLSLIDYQYVLYIGRYSTRVQDFIDTSTYMELMNFVKLLRLTTLFLYINSIRQTFDLNTYFVKLLKLTLLIMISILWTAGITYIYTVGPDRKNLRMSDAIYFAYVCMQRVMSILLLFGITHNTNEFAEMSAQFICLLFGFLLKYLVLCQILLIRTKYDWSTRKFHQMTKQLVEFMRFKSLPLSIQRRILTYCDFRFHTNYYREQEIMAILSPQLQQEVMLQAHVNLLSKMTLFQELPLQMLFDVILLMKSNYYLPGDVIVALGSHSDSIYFINTGSVALYTSAGKEIGHLIDGDYFGELAFMGDMRTSPFNIVAIECCEIYELSRAKFMFQLSTNVVVSKQVRKSMNKYIGLIRWGENEYFEKQPDNML